MTRRSGIIAVIAGMAAHFTGHAEAQGQKHIVTLNLDPVPYSGAQEID